MVWPRDCGSLTIWLFTAACEGPILWIFPRPTTDHSPPLPVLADAAGSASASDDVKYHFVCFVHVDGGCSVHADFVHVGFVHVDVRFVRVDGGSPQGAGGREGPPPAN